MSESLLALGPPVLFVEDLERSKAFYSDVLGLTLAHEDDTSAAMVLGDDMVLLVTVESGRQMLPSLSPATPDGHAPPGMFCLFVDDVDAWYERLSAIGVEFFAAPADQPWGRRTTFLKDPDGWIWELSREIE